MSTIKNIFTPRGIDPMFNGGSRVWAEWGISEVYMDFNAQGEAVGGTFVKDCKPWNELLEVAKPFLESNK